MFTAWRKKLGSMSSDRFLGGGGEHFSGELSLYCVEYLRREKFWVKIVSVEKNYNYQEWQRPIEQKN